MNSPNSRCRLPNADTTLNRLRAHECEGICCVCIVVVVERECAQHKVERRESIRNKLNGATSF